MSVIEDLCGIILIHFTSNTSAAFLFLFTSGLYVLFPFVCLLVIW